MDSADSGKKRKIWQNAITLIVLGLALYLIIPQINALSNSWNVLNKLHLWAVSLAFVAQGLSYLGSGFLMKRTLEISGQFVSLIRSTFIVLGAASIGLVAGGTVGASLAIFRWTSGEKGSVAPPTLASLIPSLFNTFMLVVFSIFGSVHLIFVHDLTRLQLVGFTITLVF